MPDTQKLSVVVGSFNFARYLRPCLDSVLSQTLMPDEIIVSDDCSTDDSWSIITDYRDRHPQLIRAFRHDPNIGAPRNGNFSKQQATGDLIAWMDGDDRWLPELLAAQLDTLHKNPRAQMSYSNVFTIDAAGKRTGTWDDGSGSVPPSGDVFIPVYSRRFFSRGRSVFRNQLMYRELLEQTGYNDLELESFWDWDHKLRLTHGAHVAYTGKALVEYRKHGGGLSDTQPKENFRAFVAIYEKHLPLLEGKSAAEAVRVQCNIECLIARRQQRRLAAERLPRYSARAVYDRNRQRLDQLQPEERKPLLQELEPSMKRLARMVFGESIAQRNFLTALHYLREFARYRLPASGHGQTKL